MNPAFTFNSLVSLIVKELELELIVMNRMCKHGVGSLSNAATVDNDLHGLLAINSSNGKAIDPVISTNPNMTCFNCKTKGHSATECRAPCKFHPGVKKPVLQLRKQRKSRLTLNPRAM